MAGAPPTTGMEAKNSKKNHTVLNVSVIRIYPRARTFGLRSRARCVLGPGAAMVPCVLLHCAPSRHWERSHRGVLRGTVHRVRGGETREAGREGWFVIFLLSARDWGVKKDPSNGPRAGAGSCSYRSATGGELGRQIEWGRASFCSMGRGVPRGFQPPAWEYYAVCAGGQGARRAVCTQVGARRHASHGRVHQGCTACRLSRGRARSCTAPG